MNKEDIISIRKKLCITQERFAYLLGTNSSTVNRWENGKQKPSRLYIKEIKKLAVDSEAYLARRQENEGFELLNP